MAESAQQERRPLRAVGDRRSDYALIPAGVALLVAPLFFRARIIDALAAYADGSSYRLVLTLAGTLVLAAGLAWAGFTSPRFRPLRHVMAVPLALTLPVFFVFTPGRNQAVENVSAWNREFASQGLPGGGTIMTSLLVSLGAAVAAWALLLGLLPRNRKRAASGLVVVAWLAYCVWLAQDNDVDAPRSSPAVSSAVGPGHPAEVEDDRSPARHTLLR